MAVEMLWFISKRNESQNLGKWWKIPQNCRNNRKHIKWTAMCKITQREIKKSHLYITKVKGKCCWLFIPPLLEEIEDCWSRLVRVLKRTLPSVQYGLASESEGWGREKWLLKGLSEVLLCVKTLCLVWCGPAFQMGQTTDRTLVQSWQNFNSSPFHPSPPFFKH